MKNEGTLFSHTMILGIGSVASKAISFLLLPLYTAALTPAEFGTADILVNTAVLLLPLVSLHAPEAVFRFRAGGERGAFGAGLVFLVIGFSLFALFLPILGLSSLLRPYIGLLFAYVAASVLRSFLAHTLRADGAFALYALQQIFCAMLTALLQILLLTVWHRGVAGYLLAVILSDATTFLILAVCLLERWWSNGRARRPLYKKMLRYSLPLIPTAVLWWVMAVSDRYFILRLCGEHDTGLYAAAGRLPALLSFIFGVFLEAWQYAALRTEKEELGGVFGRIYALIVPFLLFSGVGLTLLARPLVRLFLAPEYASAAAFVPFLVFGVLCGGCANFLDSIYRLRLSTAASFVTALAAAVTNLFLNFLLIPRMGALGAALATALSYGGLFALRLWHTRRLLSFRRLGVPLLLSFFMFFACAAAFGLERYRTGVFLALCSLLPVLKHLYRTGVFLCRRGLILMKALQKKKKYEKNF